MERATVGESEHETGEPPQGTANGHRPKACPISLRLLAGQSCQAQESFVPCRPQGSHHPPQLDHTAGVPTSAQHLIETGGAQARMLLKRLAHEVEVWIGEGSTRSHAPFKPLGFQSGAHGLRMHSQLGGNGADLPVLAVKQPPNIRFLFGSDHSFLTPVFNRA